LRGINAFIPKSNSQGDILKLTTRFQPTGGRLQPWLSHCFNLEKHLSCDAQGNAASEPLFSLAQIVARHRNSGILTATG